MRREWVEPSGEERERLYLLIEELNEAQHIATKILRFGFHETYPETKTTNQERLEEEVGDVLAMFQSMVREGDLDKDRIEEAREAKLEKLKHFTRGHWAQQSGGPRGEG